MNSTLKTTPEEQLVTQSDNSTGSVEANPELRIAKLCVYLLILMCSASGNTLVILSVALFKRMKTVPNMFIANLAAVDLITTVSSIPFDIAAEELGYWPYGAVMCKLLWPLATFTTIAAVLTLLAISADRYVALLYPLKMRYRITKKRFYIITVIMYIIAAWAVSPYMIFQQYIQGDSNGALPTCTELWPELKYRKAYTVFLFCLQYGIPLPIMAFIYIRLGLVLYRNTKEANAFSGEKGVKRNGVKRHERYGSNISGGSIDSRTQSLRRRKQQNLKTVKMFFFIVLIFLIFMLPNQVLWLLYDFGNSEYLLAHFDLIAFICRAFTYMNSVLNAAIYGACNGSFRNAFMCTLKCQCGQKHQRQHKRSASVYRKDGYCNGRKVTRNGEKGKYGSCHNSKDDTMETLESEVGKKVSNASLSPNKKSVNFLFPTPEAYQPISEKHPVLNGVSENASGEGGNNNATKSGFPEDAYETSCGDSDKYTRHATIADIAYDMAEAEGLLQRINRDMDSQGYPPLDSTEGDCTVIQDDAKETAL